MRCGTVAPDSRRRRRASAETGKARTYWRERESRRRDPGYRPHAPPRASEGPGYRPGYAASSLCFSGPHHSRWGRRSAPLFGTFCALAVDHAGGRAGVSVRLLATFLIEGVVDLLQTAVVNPALEVAMQGTARRQVLGHVAPLATGAQHIHHAVQHLANVDVSSSPAPFSGWDQPLDPGPLLVGQVTRVA